LLTHPVIAGDKPNKSENNADVKENTLRSQLLDVLLPSMCLNRYYVAEGVRNYSHQVNEQMITGCNC